MKPARRRLLALPLAALASSLARAQGLYPERPIKVVVPFPPGGQTDVIARHYAQKAEALLGQPIVVENRPGASTMIGSDAVAKAPADGYTLLFNQTALVTNQVLLSKVPYDAFRDFAPVFRAYESAAVWAVPANGPKTLAEFIEMARAARAPISYGTAGHGSSSHFYGEILARHVGVPFTHVAYKGELPILPDLLAGRLDAGVISTASAAQYGGDGRLRTLAVSGLRRLASLPRLPTFGEQGVPGVATESFVGFFAPAATPVAVVARLHEVFSKVALMPETADKLLVNGLDVSAPLSIAEFGQQMRKARDQWADIRKNSGIALE